MIIVLDDKLCTANHVMPCLYCTYQHVMIIVLDDNLCTANHVLLFVCTVLTRMS